MTGHAYKPIAPGCDPCAVCGRGSNHPAHVLPLPGFEAAEEERREAAAVELAEEMTARLRTPKGSIESKAGLKKYLSSPLLGMES